MVFNANNLLGIGLYTPTEAAYYARISSQKLIRWVFGSKVGEAVFSPQRAHREDKNVSFLDFIQALSVKTVKTQCPEVPLEEIRRAITIAKQDFGVEFPLAIRAHRIYVLGKKLIIDIGDAKSGKELLEIRRGHKQHAFSSVVEFFIKNLEFDERGVPTQYAPYHSENGKIIMNPKVRMGEPLVQNAGYSALSLAEAVKTEGSIQEAARAYGVSERDVTVAYEYVFDYLKAAA